MVIVVLIARGVMVIVVLIARGVMASVVLIARGVRKVTTLSVNGQTPAINRFKIEQIYHVVHCQNAPLF